MFQTDYKYTIYLPKEAANRKITEHMTVKQGVCGIVNGYFGGFSTYEIDGGWEKPSGGCVKEEGYAIETITHRSESERQLQHISDFIMGHTDEREVLITTTPIRISAYHRKDYHNE